MQELERQRIAQDMHDVTNQLLIGTMLELKSAQARIGNGRLEQAEASLKSVQNILHRVESYTNIPCCVKVFGEPFRLPPHSEISMYRMAQEALQNVSSHANATHAKIIISFAPKLIKLNIMDDGCGFDLNAVETNNIGHLGLLGMRERAESLGGQLTIHSEKGEGTTIELSVPIKTAVAAGAS